MSAQHDFTKDLLRWYSSNGRHFPWRQPDLTLYEVLVSEILLWKTRADTVSNLYPGFISLYPDVTAIENTSTIELATALQPLGLQNRKAAMLKNAARATFIQGITDEQAFRKTFGVGQYIARATLAIYYDIHVVPVDANIRRLLARVFGLNIKNIRTISPEEDEALSSLLPSDDHKRFIWAMIDHPSLICTKRHPLCDACTFSSYCESHPF